MFKSQDKGASWTKLDGTLFDTAWLHDLKFNPHDTNKLLISSSSFKESWMPNYTTNEGLWEYDISNQIFTQLRTTDTYEVAFDAVSTTTMIAIWEDGIHISTDSGMTWTSQQPFSYNYRYFVTPHPTNTNHWFFGYWNAIFDNGIIETTNGGLTFQEVKYNGGTNNAKLTYPPYAATNYNPSFANASSCLSFSPANNSIAYTGDWYGVWRSEDANLNLSNGNASNVDNSNWSWDWTAQGIHSLVQLRIGQHPTIDGLFYNCVADIGYYKAENYGATLEHKTAIPISSVYKIAFEKNDPLIGYAVGKQYNNLGRITKTIDGGNNWFEPSSGNPFVMSFFENGGASTITDLEIADNADESLIVGIEKGSMPSQIYRSDDQGVNFYAWDDGISGINLFKVWTSIDHLVQSADGQSFYTWNENKFYKRHLNDAAWQTITPPAGADKWIAQCISHPIDPNTIYVSHYGFGIYKSVDGGNSWTNLPMTGVANTELAISPDGQKLVVVDAENFDQNRAQKLFLTLDEGVSWQTLSTDCLLTPAVGIEFLSNEKLIAWTEGTGSHIIDLVNNQITETGSLFTKIDNIIDNIPGSSGDDYMPPTTDQMDDWELMLDYLWNGNLDAAATIAFTLQYDLVTFTDDSGEIYYILESQEINGNHWGTFVFNPNACQTNLVIQSPHPKNDLNTGQQGVHIFETISASFYMVAGTHRCNSSTYGGCSGSTSTCGSSEDYRISDMAHTEVSMFQRTTAFLLDKIPDVYFMQLHGFGWDPDEPYIILSNGTTIAPAVDLLTPLGDSLLLIDPTLTYGVAHITPSLPLKGTTNTQGRLINNSPAPCTVAATQNVGRFFHIEQEYSKLRANQSAWDKMGTAINQLIKNVNINQVSLPSGRYQAKHTLTAQTSVEALGDVLLQAGECVLLAPEFEVEINSTLEVSIENCGSGQ